MAEGELFSTIELSHVVEIEEAAFAAWPAEDVVELGGWRLRASGGVTGRANSVWCTRIQGSTPIEPRIFAVEEYYAARDLPARYQLNAASLPDGLDERLAQRGYQRVSPTLVQIASLETLLQRTPALRTMPHVEIELAEEFEQEWFDLYEAIEGEDPAQATGRAAILDRTPAPRAFLTAKVDGVPAAVGLGVVSGAYVGIFCMATHADFRRRGAATGILRAMAIWADMNRASTAYLQVTAGNFAGLAVYNKLGFRTAYNYHYRLFNPRAHAPQEGSGR